MKKVLLVIVIAMFGFGPANANVLGSAKIIKQQIEKYGMYNNDTRKIPADVMSVDILQSGFTCTVTVKFVSNGVNVTMTFVAATCTEAWASAKKVVDVFMK